MDIIRHDDGSLTVPVEPDRHANDDKPEAEVELGSHNDDVAPG